MCQHLSGAGHSHSSALESTAGKGWMADSESGHGVREGTLPSLCRRSAAVVLPAT
jgi:hypothetical protein